MVCHAASALFEELAPAPSTHPAVHRPTLTSVVEGPAGSLQKHLRHSPQGYLCAYGLDPDFCFCFGCFSALDSHFCLDYPILSGTSSRQDDLDWDFYSIASSGFLTAISFCRGLGYRHAVCGCGSGACPVCWSPPGHACAKICACSPGCRHVLPHGCHHDDHHGGPCHGPA